MIKLPQQVYQRFATILGLEGTTGLEALQSEVVPTQDLSRVMQASRVDRYFYQFGNTPAASAALTLGWDDLSDWTTVRRNGILVSDDAGLPPATHERIIAAIGLQVSGTEADYTTAAAYRFMPSGHTSQLIEFGAITSAVHRGPVVVAPNLLPQWLVPGEVNVNLVQEVSGIAAVMNWQVQMIAAETGVMAAFTGV